MAIYRKKTYKRTSRKSNGIAKKALRMVKKVKRELAPEIKFHDVTQAYTVSSAAVSTFPVNYSNGVQNHSIITGTTNTSRTGLVVRPSRIYLRYVLNKHTSATSSRLRVLFCKWETVNMIVPIGSDVLESNTVFAHRGFQYRNVIKVLSDRTHILNANMPEKMIVQSYKATGVFQYQTGSTSTASPLIKNAYFLMFISDEAVNTVSVDVNCRTVFTDV